MRLVLAEAFVEMVWSINNKRHYIDKYEFTKYGDCFLVKVSDLTLGTDKKIKLRCDDCGARKDIRFCEYTKSSFYKDGQIGLYYCPKCRNAFFNKKTDAEFKLEIKLLVGDSYLVLTDYSLSNVKVKFKHVECQHIFDMKPNSFLIGQRCPRCSGTMKKTNDEFIKQVFDLVGEEYTVLGEYKNNRTKIKMIHNVCNNEIEVKPLSFLQGKVRCYICSGKMKKTTDQFKQEVKTLTNNTYVVIGEYVNSKTKIRIKHIECNNIFEMKPNAFLSGQRCLFCKESKGEKRVRDFLQERRVDIKQQYRIEDCKNVVPLRFDFGILDASENLICLIEYDGRQHFEAINYWGGEESFKYTQNNDNIKNTYCKENNIPLIRIPYWDYQNIEQILTEQLSHLIRGENINVAYTN
jgi:hypothetical protein